MWRRGNYVDVSELLGKTIKYTDLAEDNEEVVIHTTDGAEYLMYHDQDCCEYVYVAEVIGDVDDLLDSPILMAEEVSQDASNGEPFESATWTFYKFATNKGYVTIRWLGESNGYYSEDVSFIKTKDEEESE